MPEVLKRVEKVPYGTAAALFGGGIFEMPGPPGATKRVHRGKSGEAAVAARTVGRWETGGKAPEAAGAAGPSVLNRLGRREDGAGVAAGWTLPKAKATAAQEGKAVARERLSAREERASQLGRDKVEEEEDTAESPLACGRKRRVEEPERSGTRGKSPRGEEEEELLGYDEERDGIGEVVASDDDEDMMGQD